VAKSRRFVFSDEDAAGHDFGSLAPTEADLTASSAPLGVVSGVVGRLRRSTTASIGDIRPFEIERGMYPIDRLSKNTKAAIVASDRVLPVRIDPLFSGSLSSILKDGMPSVLAEEGASTVTA
jgi:hypothetical protein